MLLSAIKLQVQAVKNHLFVFLLILATAGCAIYTGYRHSTLLQSLAYLPVMWLCMLITDIYALRMPGKKDLIVRKPKQEATLFIINICLALLFFYIRFSPAVGWNTLPGFAKLATMPLLLCLFPVLLAVVLLFMKYKLQDLGLRLHGWPLAILIALVMAVTNRLVTPESLTWKAALEESGSIPNLLFTGFITAALAEEFFRVIGQTRLGAVMHNRGMGWYITSVLWAFMHLPKWYHDGGALLESILSSLRIVPLGLMWGYMTHRTKSFVPAMLVHGSNFWGLQNF